MMNIMRPTGLDPPDDVLQDVERRRETDLEKKQAEGT